MKLFILLGLLCFFLIEESNGILRKPRKWRKKSKKKSKLPISAKRSSKKKFSLKESSLSDEYSSSCTEYYFEQRLDHFSGSVASDGTSSFMQRYYVCGKELFNWEENDPIFFYCGNEAAVTNYIEYTGLMWETASEYNALLVFAEHRFYGESMPWSEDEIYDDSSKLAYARVDQALEDYASLIRYLKTELNSDSSPIIGFGGSYGGMLASWFRMKYPQYMDGAIAGSAPILQIYGLSPEADPYSFSAIETKDASLATLTAVYEITEANEAAADDDEKMQAKNKNRKNRPRTLDVSKLSTSSETCQKNLQTSWDVIEEYSATSVGRETLGSVFNLCSTPSDSDTAEEIIYVVEEAIAYMAMSSFAYESSYITQAVLGTDSSLPAYPVSYACGEYLTTDMTSDTSDSGKLELLTAVSNFNKVFWNADDSDSCIDLDTLWDSFDDYLWDYLYCDSLMMPSGSLGSDSDMFWDDEWDADSTIEYCEEYYGVSFDSISGAAAVKYGGYDLYKSMSNVVFSNGAMDPWSLGGVYEDSLVGSSDSLISVMISYNGHHADLMFSDSSDSEELLAARALEKENINKWIEQAYSKTAVGMCSASTQSMWEKLSTHPIISAMNMVL